MVDNTADALAWQTEEIVRRFCQIYHKEYGDGKRLFLSSVFYRALSAPGSRLLSESVEDNFVRFQNEIEYGKWDR